MHLKDATISWWWKVVKEGKEPKTSKKFFLFTFEVDVWKEYDALQKESETVESYINKV